MYTFTKLSQYMRACYLLVALILTLTVGCSKSPEANNTAVRSPANSDAKAGLVIEQAFMYKPIGASLQGVIYMKAHNFSNQPMVLNYIHTPVADRVEVHTHLHEDGLMKMRKVNHFTFQASRPQNFEPGGYHLMVFDMVDNIAEYSEFKLTMEFEGAPPIIVPVNIKPRK